MTRGAKANKKLRSSPTKSRARTGARAPAEPSLADTLADTLAAARVPSTDPGRSEELVDIEAIEVDISSFDLAFDEPMQQPDGAARGSRRGRRAERMPVEEKVEISGAFGLGMDHTVRDASLHGLFVETAYLLEVGDPVALTLPLLEGGRLKVSGRVRWVTPFGGLNDARAGMGIELVSLVPAARRALSSLLQRRIPPRSHVC